MPTEPEFDDLDQLIEAHIRFLRDGDPAPDLSNVDPSVATEAREIFEIIKTMVNSAPATPPLEQDPVAVRLGVINDPGGISGGESLESVDAVTAAMEELEYRLDVAVEPVVGGEEGFEHRFECRSVVERVLVVVTTHTDPVALSANARGEFAVSDDLSAVTYSSADAENAVVVTFGDCHQRLDPARGWTNEDEPIGWAPLGIALGRYIERSDPEWEQVQSLDASGALAGMETDVLTVVADQKRALRATRPRLSHKQVARDFVTACANERFVAWAQGVRSETVSTDDLLAEFRELVQEGPA